NDLLNGHFVLSGLESVAEASALAKRGVGSPLLLEVSHNRIVAAAISDPEAGRGAVFSGPALMIFDNLRSSTSGRRQVPVSGNHAGSNPDNRFPTLSRPAPSVSIILVEECIVIGNHVVNAGRPSDATWSLYLYPVNLATAADTAVFAIAVTGNVFQGR